MLDKQGPTIEFSSSRRSCHINVRQARTYHGVL
jgi:hypothetical protein